MLDALLGFIAAHPFISAAIFVALVFDFVNGFHDSANAIATVVATKVLTPAKALVLAATFNFIGPFLLGTAVAATIGKGIIHTTAVGAGLVPSIVFGALAGAIIWNLVTWYFGLPSSSSHALVGGLVGAALAAAGGSGVVAPTWAELWNILRFIAFGIAGGLAAGVVALGVSRLKLPRGALPVLAVVGAVAMGYVFYTHNAPRLGSWREGLGYSLTLGTMIFLGVVGGLVLWMSTQQRMPPRLVLGFSLFGACVSLVVSVLMGGLKLGGVTKTVLFMFVSPVLGFFAGFLLSSGVSWIARVRDPVKVSAVSKRAQIASASFYALTHGTNDAQKTMGIIAVLLVAAGTLTTGTGASLDIPTWVFVTSAGAMGLGTLFGGWRIIKTMASKITHLTPIQGFAAETGGGVVLVGMAQAGIPVSTTHAITASIMGVGATRRSSAVRWGVGRRIVGAWFLTIPASAAVAYASYFAVTPDLLVWYRAHPAIMISGVAVVAVIGSLVLWLKGRRAAVVAGQIAEAATGR